MADKLKESFGVESEMIAGSGGIFDVKVDGKMVYSKHVTGAFPDHAQLIRQITKLAAAGRA